MKWLCFRTFAIRLNAHSGFVFTPVSLECVPLEVLRAALRTTARDTRSGFVSAIFLSAPLPLVSLEEVGWRDCRSLVARQSCQPGEGAASSTNAYFPRVYFRNSLILLDHLASFGIFTFIYDAALAQRRCCIHLPSRVVRFRISLYTHWHST